MTKWYWISCSAFTCGVETDFEHKIINSAPILQKFKGQSLTNLTYWLDKKFREYKIVLLKGDK